MGKYYRSGVQTEAVVSHCPSSPRRLKEAEKQSQALQQEVAELREELQGRGPGGECPLTTYPEPVCSSGLNSRAHMRAVCSSHTLLCAIVPQKPPVGFSVSY